MSRDDSVSLWIELTKEGDQKEAKIIPVQRPQQAIELELGFWSGTSRDAQPRLLWAVSDDHKWGAHGRGAMRRYGLGTTTAAESELRLCRLKNGEVIGPIRVQRLVGLEFERGSSNLLVATLGAPPHAGKAGGLALYSPAQPEIILTRWQVPELTRKEEICRQRLGPAVRAQSLPGWLRLNDRQYFAPGRSELERWNLDNGRREVAYRGHAGPVTSLAIHPDGRTIATGSSDGTVRLWDAATGEEKLLLEAREAGTQVLAFVAGGRTLVTRSVQSGKHVLSFWRAATDARRCHYARRRAASRSSEEVGQMKFRW